MSTLAVVLALAGSSYAASGIAADAVKSKQIKNGAVKSVDVKDGGLLAVDFKSGELPAGPRGPAGATGAAGAPGATGPTYGHTRPTGFSLGTAENFVAAESFTLPTAGPVFVSVQTGSGYVNCPSPTSILMGVTIDGVSVPGTVHGYPTNNTDHPFSASGVSASLSAGTHDIHIAGSCVGASTSNGIGVDDPSLTVVLLGAS